MATGASGGGRAEAGLATAGALLREIARLHARGQREQVSCCGTTVAQCHILTELGRSGALPLTELGRRLGLHKGWISRGVATLVASGLVVRRGQDGDGRVVVVSLSRAGERRVAALNASLDRHAANVLARIPVRERRQVGRALRLVSGALRDELAASREARGRTRCAGDESS